MAMVSSDLRPEHGQAEARPRSLLHRPRVSMLVPLRRLARAPSRQSRSGMTTAAVASALGVAILLCALVVGTTPPDRPSSGRTHIQGWPTDTIEAWLRHMTITPSVSISPEAPTSSDQPRAQEPSDGLSSVADE